MEDLEIDQNLTDLTFLGEILEEEESRCLQSIAQEDGDKSGHCMWSWDGVLCWPPSLPGQNITLPCRAVIHGIEYDTSQNATRHCYLNGTWANYSDYSSCINLQKPDRDLEDGVEVTTMIYSVGYGLSLVALCLAVFIFTYFKDLRCLRNTIHTNLMCTYILADFMWILNYSLQEKYVQMSGTDVASCVILVLLLHYFHLTNFYWMFVEGLYLYMLVVETFTRENIKLRVYLITGWGTPALVTITWALYRTFSSNPQESGEIKQIVSNCTWMAPNTSDIVYQGAALLVLAANLVFLCMIMWVLITKLRSSNNVETQQYRKASKALLVLIPLLGITYLLFIVGPTEGVYANIYSYMRAFLLSTQGFTVALFYCFLNTEVQNTCRHHFSRWKESRDIGARRYTYSKDWSPNTRTESMRLYSKHELAPCKKRESNVSENTSMTTIGGRLSNGSMGNILKINTLHPHLSPPTENSV